MEVAANAAGAVGRVGAAVAAGKTLTVTANVRRARMAACDECAPGSLTCPECGCVKFLKTMLTTETCPLDKWAEE